MIDFCDYILLWRTADGLSRVPVRIFIYWIIHYYSISNKTIRKKIAVVQFMIIFICIRFTLCFAQVEQELRKKIDDFNSTRPLCPVTFKRLWLAKEDEPIECGHSIDSDCNCGPMFVNLTCGHVQGNWPCVDHDTKSVPVCSICRADWKAVKLSVGKEPSFCVDREPLSHCFDPCGHVVSEMTSKYIF